MIYDDKIEIGSSSQWRIFNKKYKAVKTPIDLVFVQIQINIQYKVNENNLSKLSLNASRSSLLLIFID